MFSKLLRGTLTGVVGIAMVGGTLFLGPAANAAAPHVDRDLQHVSAHVLVNKHHDALRLTAASKQAQGIKLGLETQHFAAKYKISVSHGHHVLYVKTTTVWRALLATYNAGLGSYSTDAQLVRGLKGSVALPEREARAGVEATAEQLRNEAVAQQGAFKIRADVKAWLAEQSPAPAGLSGYTILADEAHAGEGLGVSFKVSGTPAAFKVVGTVEANGARIAVDQDGHVTRSKLSLTRQLLKNIA